MTYTKVLWSYMYLLEIILFVQGAVGLPLPENLGYLLIVTCTQSEVPIVLRPQEYIGLRAGVSESLHTEIYP